MIARKPASPGLRLALDYAPLIAFLIVNFFAPGPALARLIAATVAFMIAMVIAVVVSWVMTRHVSPMMWITAVLVIVFGGLTLYFHDERFIKMKPTFIYVLFAGVLAFGLLTGRPLLRQLLEAAYPGLTDTGWRKLTLNWAIFFVVMAAANEIVWRSVTTDQWVLFKFPGVPVITLLFVIANVPMLMRHGLNAEVPAPVPPEG